MDCKEMGGWLDAYVDDELDPERSARVEAHTRECEGCKALVQERRRLAEIVAGVGHRAAPASVRDAVVRDLADESLARPRALARAPAWAWVAVAAAVVLAGATAWLAVRRAAGVPMEDILIREAVSSHIRSLMGAHLMDIAASDQHAVKPWFAGKLDYAPRVSDFAAQGFPLAGGRLDYVGGRPVAAVVYNRRAHVINLYTCPEQTGIARPARATEDRGYHVVTWSDGSVRFCAVSDVSGEELGVFVGMVRGEH